MILTKQDIIKTVICVVLAIAMFVSFFPGADWAQSPEKHSKQIAQIDNSISSVMTMTGTTAVVSTAVTCLPGDVATPVADQLAELTDYFLITLCVLFAEKYMLTILAYIVFRYIIPLACLAGITGVIFEKNKIKMIAVKAIAVSLAIAFTIPAGLKVSELITNTYEASINNTIALGEEINAESDSKITVFLQAKQLASKVVNFVKGIIEAVAVMLVTACVIPICIFCILIWIIKTFIVPPMVVAPPMVESKIELNGKTE